MRYLASAALGIVGIRRFDGNKRVSSDRLQWRVDCWHAKKKCDYRPEFNVQVYPDDWRWAEADNGKYRWRKHEGPGYWRGGVWIGF
jgi:hypothetical protein